MYWSITQQITHHSISGCIMNPGDLIGSGKKHKYLINKLKISNQLLLLKIILGTISGNEKESWGSLMEISWAGKEPVKLSNGEERTFLQNGDTLIMRGYAEKDGYL